MSREYPEQVLQIAVVETLKVALAPPAEFWATPNGGLLPGGSPRMRLKAGALRKAMGVRAGVADLCVMWPGGFGMVELKAPTAPKNALSDEQVNWRNATFLNRHRWAECRSVEAVLDVLAEWGAPIRMRVAA